MYRYWKVHILSWIGHSFAALPTHSWPKIWKAIKEWKGFKCSILYFIWFIHESKIQLLIDISERIDDDDDDGKDENDDRKHKNIMFVHSLAFQTRRTFL